MGEYAGIQTKHDIACFIEEYPNIAGEFLSHFGCDIDEARQAMEDNYCGCYRSVADYSEELTEETTQIPQNLAYYIDYEKGP